MLKHPSPLLLSPGTWPAGLAWALLWCSLAMGNLQQPEFRPERAELKRWIGLERKVLQKIRETEGGDLSGCPKKDRQRKSLEWQRALFMGIDFSTWWSRFNNEMFLWDFSRLFSKNLNCFSVIFGDSFTMPLDWSWLLCSTTIRNNLVAAKSLARIAKN